MDNIYIEAHNKLLSLRKLLSFACRALPYAATASGPGGWGSHAQLGRASKGRKCLTTACRGPWSRWFLRFSNLHDADVGCAIEHLVEVLFAVLQLQLEVLHLLLRLFDKGIFLNHQLLKFSDAHDVLFARLPVMYRGNVTNKHRYTIALLRTASLCCSGRTRTYFGIALLNPHISVPAATSAPP